MDCGDWSYVCSRLTEKTKQRRNVYLLDNSFHAGDCADLEVIVDKGALPKNATCG